MSDVLFPDDGIRVAPSLTEEGLTAGERMRRRQAARIACGYHPLALQSGTLRLHPDAPRVQSKADAAELDDYLRCGTCRFRESFGGHSRSFPKCVFGRTETPVTDEMRARSPILYGGAKVVIDYPRAAHSDATDVRAWWPACPDHQQASDTPVDDTAG